MGMAGKSKKKQKKMIQSAIVNYFKNILLERFGKEKSPEKKEYRKLHSGTKGVLGAEGFVIKHVLANADEFDYYHAPSKLGEALEGKSGIVFCEWTGATEAVFYFFEAGVDEVKY